MGFQTIEHPGEPPIIVGWCALALFVAALAALGIAHRTPWQDLLPLQGRWLRAFLVGVAVISGAVAILAMRPLGELVGSLVITWPSTCILAATAVAIFQIAKVLLGALIVVARQFGTGWRQFWWSG